MLGCTGWGQWRHFAPNTPNVHRVCIVRVPSELAFARARSDTEPVYTAVASLTHVEEGGGSSWILEFNPGHHGICC